MIRVSLTSGPIVLKFSQEEKRTTIPERNQA